VDLKELHAKYGQSIWLDYIRRHLLTSGELKRLVQEDGVRGVTSNPAIFQKAIAGSTDYEAAIRAFEGAHDGTATAIYEHLAIEDIRQAADILRPVYDAAQRADGFVSMEVSPYLAHDTEGTLNEARRLWKSVARDNLMVKVPGTPQGIPAIRQLISEGININVTLLFSRTVCARVLDAYMAGLEQFAQSGGDLSRVASVASVFVSRIDAALDPLLEAPVPGHEASALARRALVGQIGIANAKLTYRDWQETCRSARWQALAVRGARVQRLLWASTGTKDPRMKDVAYVEALIGPDTVDTVPPATLDAFRDHGTAADRLARDSDVAAQRMAALASAGISIDEVTDRLLTEGVKSFAAAFDGIMASLEQKRVGVLQSALDRTSYRLPAPLDAALKVTLEDWRSHDKVRRLWARDASLWTGQDEAKWLDWLGLADDEQKTLDGSLLAFAQAIRPDFDHAVVLGMGGSSLCPDVLSRTIGAKRGYPELLVLDSTDPAQIRAIEARVSLDRTLFIVSSKSGSTLEPNVLCDYFYERVQQRVGAAQAGRQFVAVTDPGSALERFAEQHGFARIFAGIPGIGGRYSALSNFGMVPAAVMGLDVPKFLERTARMVHACAACVPPEQNPGVLLGAILGTLAKHGRDKVTLIASSEIEELGAWLEQLLAESTGKEGRALIPIDREPPGAPDVYGSDRVFVYLRLDGWRDAALDAAVDVLEQAGQPLVRIALGEVYDLGQEFFRWEVATAVASSMLGVHAFNQPDVELSKVETRKLTDAYDKTGTLPEERPFYREGALQLFADETNRTALEKGAAGESLSGYLAAHLARLHAGDYFALLAYVQQCEAHDRALQALRLAIRDRHRIATCEEFGPRFLHSTGQAYKGGPNSGVFLQLTCDDPADLAVPGRRYTFGVVKAAQARGDFAVLAQRKRRALRVHLGPDVSTGLEALAQAMHAALAR
jgi:transaldolase/glucose-6-phosphate isomerase